MLYVGSFAVEHMNCTHVPSPASTCRSPRSTGGDDVQAAQRVPTS